MGFCNERIFTKIFRKQLLTRMTTESINIEDRTDLSGNFRGAVVLVNVFTPKPGQMDAFVAAQTGEYKRLLGKITGWIGNRLHRSLDGKLAVNYAIFESLDTYKAWRDSELFQEHIGIIAPFVERSEPGIYEILYQAGDMSPISMTTEGAHQDV